MIDGRSIVTDSPHFYCTWNPRNRVQEVATCSRIRAGNYLPVCSIPVFDQRLTNTMAARCQIIADGPDIVCRNYLHCIQLVPIRTDIGAANNTPRGTIPMFDKGLLIVRGKTARSIRVKGPDVTCR